MFSILAPQDTQRSLTSGRELRKPQDGQTMVFACAIDSRFPRDSILNYQTGTTDGSSLHVTLFMSDLSEPVRLDNVKLGCLDAQHRERAPYSS